MATCTQREVQVRKHVVSRKTEKLVCSPLVWIYLQIVSEGWSKQVAGVFRDEIGRSESEFVFFSIQTRHLCMELSPLPWQSILDRILACIARPHHTKPQTWQCSMFSRCRKPQKFNARLIASQQLSHQSASLFVCLR